MGKGLKDSQLERLALLLQSPERPHGRTRRCTRGDHGVLQTHPDEAERGAQVEV